MKLFKTVPAKTYTTSGTESLNSLIPAADRAKAVIAEIEIYALGAGGGGQGGDDNDGMFINDIGTGGAGGGGAASYIKLGSLGLKPGETVSLKVTVGAGGTGGSYYSSGWGGTTASGSPGANGGSTKVEWEAKSITLNASGGNGGGGNGSLTPGGSGGTAGSLPNNASYYKDGATVSGESGTGGNLSYDVKSAGGKAAKITKGSLSSFGGGNGTVRSAGGTWQQGEAGGGGSGGYSRNDGRPGNNGLVTIVVNYYTEE